MNRKIIQLGRNTKIMSLPSAWTEKYALTKGQDLAVEERGSTLLVTAPATHNTIDSTLDFRDRPADETLWNRLIWRRLVAAYVKGADKVTILYNMHDTFTEKKIEEYVIDLNGFTILHKTKTEFVLKDIAPPQTKDLDEILKHIFFILREMSEFATGALQKQIPNAYGAHYSMEVNLNRLSYLCLRIINRNGLFEYQKNNSVYRIITLLEEIGDQYRRIVRRYEENPAPVSKSIIAELETMHSILVKLQNLYFQYTQPSADALYKDYKPLGGFLRAVKPNNTFEEITLSYLLETRDLTKSIYEEILVINS